MYSEFGVVFFVPVEWWERHAVNRTVETNLRRVFGDWCGGRLAIIIVVH